MVAFNITVEFDLTINDDICEPFSFSPTIKEESFDMFVFTLLAVD